MSDLPKYALELKNRQFSRSGPQNFVPIRFSDDAGNEQFNDFDNRGFSNDPNDIISGNTYENSTKESTEADKLREIISDLEDQIARLQNDGIETEELEQQIDKERSNVSELSQKVDEALKELKMSQETAKTQEDEVSYFESVLSGKNELAASKENMLVRLHTEYDNLMSDYKRILRTTKNQGNEIRQAKEEIDELEREIQDLKSSNSFYNYDNFSSPNQQLQPQTSFNDFQTYPTDDVFINNNNENRFEINDQNSTQNTNFLNEDQISQVKSNKDKVPAAMRDSFGLSFIEEPPDKSNLTVSSSNFSPRGSFSPTRTGTPRAMADNISFNMEDQSNNENSNKEEFYETYGDMMTKEEIEKELSSLMKEKEETEKICNRSPPKGMPISRARRIRQENEDKLDLIDQKMGKLRLILRQRTSS